MATLTNKLLVQARDCLSELIDSAFLDATEMANDCLEGFATYEWEPKSDLSETEGVRWSELHKKGNGSELDGEELLEFLELTSSEGQTHIYYHRIQARKLVDSIQEYEKGANLQANSIDKASRSAAAKCLFDLKSEERNVDVVNVLSAEAIFDAVQLSSSLTINVDNVVYELEPYWPYLSPDIALEIIEDIRTAIESELTTQYKSLTESSSHFDNDKRQIPFTLQDECERKENIINGFIDNKIGLGIALHFNGYSDCCSKGDNGTPVYIEKYNGDLRIIVYSDINREEPTHIISLEGARNDKRVEESPQITKIASM
jgi:hypothetical protein